MLSCNFSDDHVASFFNVFLYLYHYFFIMLAYGEIAFS